LIFRLTDYSNNVIVATNLLAGTPHWRAYQNPVLGALVQGGIEKVLSPLLGSGASGAAYDALMLGSVFCVLLSYRLAAGARSATPSGQYAFFGALTISYVMIQDRNWFYPWDPVEVITFALLYVLILRQRPLRDFWLLFAIAIFNKETTAFIGVWL